MNDLDATRLSLAKAINDAEGALAGKEAELTRLKEETRAVEMSDPAAEHDLDGPRRAPQLRQQRARQEQREERVAVDVREHVRRRDPVDAARRQKLHRVHGGRRLTLAHARARPRRCAQPA